MLNNEVTAEGKPPSGFMAVMNEFDRASYVNLVRKIKSFLANYVKILFLF